jgi:hypothetical protein
MHEDSKRYVASCPECQRTDNISQKNAMPLNYNLHIDLFNVEESIFCDLSKIHMDMSIF